MIKTAQLYWILLLLPLSLFCQRKEDLPVKGLHAPVEVLRDEWGVNHIYASNQHDLFFAQGYCAAQDRLFQFEIWRRQATGTMAEIFGPREVRRDIGARLFKYRGDINREYTYYHPQGNQIIAAFTEGVNAYIRKALKDPASLPAEFRILNISPDYWTPDVVVSRHASIMYNANQELNLARAILRSDTTTVKELFWFHPQVPSVSLDPSLTRHMLDKDILGLYTAFKRDVNLPGAQATTEVAMAELQQSLDGSNNWIVGGARSSSGFPLLANDPHRRIGLPSLRYMVHLSAPGWNVTGAGEPTMPGVSIGHNDHGAWGLTIAETDAEDIYVYDVDPLNMLRYQYKGSWLQMKEIMDTIHVKNSSSQPVRLRYTLHGPVTYIDTALRKAYVLRCAWLEPGGAPYMASLRINQAKNWDEFRQACSYASMPGENMIWADRKGNIGWQVVGILPNRIGYSGYVPVPGDGQFEWDGFFPVTNRPHLLNPANGFLATANEYVTPGNYPYKEKIGSSWSDPFRGNRIREVLASSTKHTLEGMAELQHDYLSLPARKIVPLLRNISFNKGAVSQARDSLLNWDFRLEKNSIPASIYVMWERELSARARKYFVPDSIKPFINLQMSRILDQLEKPRINFGAARNLDRDELLRESFVAAVNALEKKLGPDMSGWQYGQEKFKHVFLRNPLQPNFSLGPLPRAGNATTPGATSNLDNQNHGGSFKMVVDTRDWDQTLMINAPGQSADPKSPYYANLFRLWAEDGYFQSYFSKDKILKATKERLVLKPAR